MDRLMPAPSAPRALRIAFVTVFGLSLVFGATGCHRRRSAMRPVIIEQGSTVVTSPENCEPGLAPSSSAPTVELNQPLTDPDLAPAAGPERAAPKKSVPSKTSPPIPNDLDEPDLSLPDSSKSKPSTTGKGASFPDLNTPNTSANPKSASVDRRVPRVRQASSARERVRPWVNDPDDLFAPPKVDRPWKYIVIHHSANATGSYAQIDREHRKIQGWDGCGYHFVIGNGSESPNGQIEVARRWANQKQGLHCKNGKYPDINEYGIGICLIGDFDSAAPSPKQLEALRSLVAYLASRYDIPAERIGTHGQMASGQVSCPGENFPTDEILPRPGRASR